ncbi:sensor histidine kinase [Armatimonas sp.]|uniref:sensor histidine kinase n=1 Tax=Armatimonas sp. TaxID=1872638 RepID=UPI003752F120
MTKPQLFFRPLRRMGWPLGIAAFYLLVSLLMMAILPKSTSPLSQLRGNLIPVVGDIIGLICGFSGFWRTRKLRQINQQSLPWTAIFLTAACFSRAIADSIWAWLEWTKQTPFPSQADYFYLLVVPLILVGVLLLPTRQISRSHRMRVLLDALVGVTALLIFSWRLLISPTLLSGAALGFLARAVGLAYPTGDLLLVGSLLVLVLRSGGSLQQGMRSTIVAIGIGIISLLIADSFFLYLNLHDTYQSGTPLDLLFTLCSLCLGFGARSLTLQSITPAGRRLRVRVEEGGSDSPLRVAIPYLLVPCAGLFFFQTLLENQKLTLEVKGMCVSGAFLVLLILLRQFMALRDNWQLVRQTRDDAASLQQLNIQLQATQAELVHSAKMASLGTLSAGVAHELNQPIAIIRGLSQQMQEEPNLSKFMTEDLEQIETQTSRMMRIITHMRTFCRTTGHSTSVVCLKQLVEDCLILIGAQFHSHGITLSVHIETDKTTVKVNANEIEQVLLNLLTNARDALQNTPDATLDIRLRENNNQVILECADNGPGIPPEVLPRLFEPFFTTKEVGQGMGLGLSISMNLVKSNGGTLSAHNAPNQGGAVLTLHLPYTPAEIEVQSGQALPELKKAA